MNKQFSKHTIEKSISHWKQILENMNMIDESKSQLLSKFEDEFGTETVFSNELNVLINNDIITKIFNILNENFFQSKLNLIPDRMEILCDSCNNIQSYLNKNYNIPANTDVVSDKLALFQPHFAKVYKPNGKICLISTRNGIFINLNYGKYATFAYLISTLCHEMIHCYDCIYGQLCDMTLFYLMHNQDSSYISYASHFTPIFKQLATKMKTENNITIFETADDISYDDMNKQLANEIQSLKECEQLPESTNQLNEISNYKIIPFSDEFYKKYEGIIIPCTDGGFTMCF